MQKAYDRLIYKIELYDKKICKDLQSSKKLNGKKIRMNNFELVSRVSEIFIKIT